MLVVLAWLIPSPHIGSMPAHHVRDQIFTVLRDHPDGIATLLIYERLGASTATRRQAIAHSLGRMAAAGHVRRSGGAGVRAVWTLAPNAAPQAPSGGRWGGAAELSQAQSAARQDGHEPGRITASAPLPPGMTKRGQCQKPGSK